MNKAPWPILAAILSALLLGSGAAGSGDTHRYIGSKKCKTCHIKEHGSWEATKMGMAFEALRPGVSADAKKQAGLDPKKDYTKDATCLPCHTTGYGKEGGFVDIETTPDLAGVGCEMCHGAGGEYTKKEYMSLQNKEYKKSDVVRAGMVGAITVEQCKVCHNAESPFVGEDYVFDFEANKEKGAHAIFPLKYQH